MHAPQPGTSKAAPCHKACPYLLRKLAVTRAAQVWALDTPYIPIVFGSPPRIVGAKA